MDGQDFARGIGARGVRLDGIRPQQQETDGQDVDQNSRQAR